MHRRLGALTLARFLATYPGAYFGPWPQTVDGLIPLGVFWVLYREIPTLKAAERVNLTTGAMLAIAAATGDDVKAARQADQEQAFPDG